MPAAPRSLHRAWIVAGVALIALIAAGSFRAAPGVLMVPLQEKFGWSTASISVSVSLSLLLYGLTAPFAAALMDRLGMRQVAAAALVLIALGSALTLLMSASWHLLLSWGLLIGLGTGSVALVFAATVANRWFTRSRGLVLGILTAGGTAGQLVFLPVLALLADQIGWRAASLTVSAAALAVVPLVLTLLTERPADLGIEPYGGAGTTAPNAAGPPLGPPARPSTRCVERSTCRRSGCSPAGSRSAGCPRPVWSAPTSSRRRTTTACPEPRRRGCSRWSGCST